MMKAVALDDLRARIAVIEGGRNIAIRRVPLGAPLIDAVLPGGGLMGAAVHEIAGSAASGFAAMVLGRLKGPVLWCVDLYARSHLYGPGLAAFGIRSDQLIIVRCANRADMLWAMEEGLRTSALAGIVCEPVGAVDLTASRRLQLAAEIGGGVGLLLNRGSLKKAGQLAPNALASRWRVDNAPIVDETGACGRSRWRVELERCRGAEAVGEWMVRWHEPDGREQEKYGKTGRLCVDDAPVD
jgi:protein ImuA